VQLVISMPDNGRRGLGTVVSEVSARDIAHAGESPAPEVRDGEPLQLALPSNGRTSSTEAHRAPSAEPETAEWRSE
jgi:hypothetical protein